MGFAAALVPRDAVPVPCDPMGFGRGDVVTFKGDARRYLVLGVETQDDPPVPGICIARVRRLDTRSFDEIGVDLLVRVP